MQVLNQGIEANVYVTKGTLTKKFHWYTYMREHKFLQHLTTSGITPNYISRNRYKIEMEYLSGYAPLASLSNEAITKLLPQVIETVKKLHSLGVLHNDLHLNNILTNGSDIRLIDFNKSYFTTRGDYDFYYLKKNLEARGI